MPKIIITPIMLKAAWAKVAARWPTEVRNGQLYRPRGPWLTPGPGFKEAMIAGLREGGYEVEDSALTPLDETTT